MLITALCHISQVIYFILSIFTCDTIQAFQYLLKILTFLGTETECLLAQNLWHRLLVKINTCLKSGRIIFAFCVKMNARLLSLKLISKGYVHFQSSRKVQWLNSNNRSQLGNYVLLSNGKYLFYLFSGGE